VELTILAFGGGSVTVGVRADPGTYTPLSAPIASANLPQRHPLTYLDCINTIYQHNFLFDSFYLHDYRDLAVAPARGKAQRRRMRLKMRWSRNNILVD
jgi:hypothetical protein